MSYAPANLKDLGAYWVSQGGVNSGIVGNYRHCSGYHLGKDRIFGDCACKPDGACVPGRGWDDYSVQDARDKAGLSDAVSAIDLGKLNGSIVQLRAFSVWLVEQCQKKVPGTEWIREIIYSADGKTVQRYSGIDGQIHTGPGNGDLSHLQHTHISKFRSASGALVPTFEAYFVKVPDTATEEDMLITTIKAEDWKATPSTGAPVRDAANRAGATIFARIPQGSIVRTIAEGTTPDGNNWRVTEVGGKVGYLLRIDLEPLVQGGDPKVDAALNDFIARKSDSTTATQAQVDAAYADGKTAGMAEGRAAGYTQGVTVVQTAANAVPKTL